jgi:hypothetical protein
LAAAVAAAPIFWPGAGLAIVTSGSGTSSDPFDGIYLNDFLGADRFYNAGYTGSRTYLANIEAGAIWDGHDSLSHVAAYFHASAFQGAGVQTGEFDRHATWTGSILGARPGGDPDGPNGDFQRGIAYGSTLLSGSIATAWTSSLGFNVSNGSLVAAYDKAMLSGVFVDGATRTVDVINSSWGDSTNTNGNGFYAIALDALINQTGKVAVFPAGNSGTPSGGTNTVYSPASGFNGISVASLGAESENPAFNRRSTFSSRSPSAYFNPQTGVTTFTRAAIDIAAPGETLTLAYYGGQTGGNAPSVPGSPSGDPGTPHDWSPNKSGTSFAAPFVAGGAALLTDLGKERFGGGQAIDARVVKAVLMNSADKTSGWNNGQSSVVVMGNPVISTSQSLDYDVGAGRMNLDRAFDQYVAGTGNVAGDAGGIVQATGWDFGRVSAASPNNDYFIDADLLTGTKLTVTLDWFVDRALTINYATNSFNASNQSFDNLDLEIWSVVGGAFTTLKARSISTVNNVEHLFYDIASSGRYGLRVKWVGESYDLVGDANFEDYGLAWSATALSIAGDFNRTGVVDASDIDLLLGNLGGNASIYDLNGDSLVTSLDVDYLLEHILHRRFGDTNLDGSVDALDVAVFRSYLGSAGAGWIHGNFNGDGSVDAADLGLLRANLGLGPPGLDDALLFGFEASGLASTALASVPEPGAATIWLVALSVLGSLRRRTRSTRWTAPI